MGLRGDADLLCQDEPCAQPRRWRLCRHAEKRPSKLPRILPPFAGKAVAGNLVPEDEGITRHSVLGANALPKSERGKIPCGISPPSVRNSQRSGFGNPSTTCGSGHMPNARACTRTSCTFPGRLLRQLPVSLANSGFPEPPEALVSQGFLSFVSDSPEGRVLLSSRGRLLFRCQKSCHRKAIAQPFYLCANRVLFVEIKSFIGTKSPAIPHPQHRGNCPTPRPPVESAVRAPKRRAAEAPAPCRSVPRNWRAEPRG